MADTTYKRLDYDQLLYYTNYLLNKIKTSSLADNTEYTISINGSTITLTPTNGTAQTITLSKSSVGLGNVNNTSDANKPISTATQTALDGKLSTSLKGAANGVAELDSSGKVPSSQLPSYVDDVVEYSSQSKFPTTGEAGKIYVATDTNLTYRWGGSSYVVISSSLALGETSSTAYRGDRGKQAYDDSRLAIKNITRNGTTFTCTRFDDTTFTFTQQDNTVSPTTTTPKAPGTAAVGSETKYARGDHVHPLQTTVSGNAGTATILKNGRLIDGVWFNGSSSVSHYAVCETAPDEVAKTVICDGWSEVQGAIIIVDFKNDIDTSISSSLTLKVNDGMAHQIFYQGSPINGYDLRQSGKIHIFLWDGQDFQVVGDFNTDTSNYYALATQSRDGLMSHTDKQKLDGLDASKYVLHTEMTTLTNSEITTIIDGAYTSVFGS